MILFDTFIVHEFQCLMCSCVITNLHLEYSHWLLAPNQAPKLIRIQILSMLYSGKLGSIGNVVVGLGGPFPCDRMMEHSRALRNCTGHSHPILGNNDTS